MTEIIKKDNENYFRHKNENGEWVETTMNGMISRVMGYLDENGNPVERIPATHPYSYDAHVIYNQPGFKYKDQTYEKDGLCTVYSDRLSQWDYEKYRECMKQFKGEDGDYFWRDTNKVVKFMKKYYNNKKLEVNMIMEGCNVSNGYPYWLIFYKDNK